MTPSVSVATIFHRVSTALRAMAVATSSHESRRELGTGFLQRAGIQRRGIGVAEHPADVKFRVAVVRLTFITFGGGDWHHIVVRHITVVPVSTSSLIADRARIRSYVVE